MKHLITLLLLILSSRALATLTILNSVPIVATAELIKIEAHLLPPSINMTVQQGSINVENLLPAFWQSNNHHLLFTAITVVRANQLARYKDTLFAEGNGSYYTDNLQFNVKQLPNNTLIIPQQKIVIQGALTVWTVNHFSLSIQGRIEASQTRIGNDNFSKSSLILRDETKLTKSFSMVSSYLLSENWAVTGLVMKRSLNGAFKANRHNKKASDNVAIIGTTYSF